jgi:hypothetical protein
MPAQVQAIAAQASPQPQPTAMPAMQPQPAAQPAAPAVPAKPVQVASAVAMPPPGVAERAPVLDMEAEAPSVARPYVPPPERRTLPDGVPDLSMPPSEVAE